MSLLSPFLSHSELAREVSKQAIKAASNPAETSFALGGRLYFSSSGWLMLSVPNALVRGCFDALQELGAELPPSGPEGKLNAHISVCSPEEIAKLGGADKISERGHTFRYTLGRVKTVTPADWDDIGRVWIIEVYSPELQTFRKSYGLDPLPRHPFHITIAVRRKKVLQNSDVSKISEAEGHNGEIQSETGVQAG